MRSFRPYFRPSPRSLQIWMKRSSTNGNHGASVAAVKARPVKHNKEEYFGKMMELFKERLCKMLQDYKHIYDVTCPGTGTDNSNRTAGKEEIGREMNVSWMAEKKKWRSM